MLLIGKITLIDFHMFNLLCISKKIPPSCGISILNVAGSSNITGVILKIFVSQKVFPPVVSFLMMCLFGFDKRLIVAS